MSNILQYNPLARLTASEALIHPFFDELRNPDTKMPTGKILPPLFDFSIEGIVFYIMRDLSYPKSLSF
jgi:glycogen synthase kinase 3 beta